jgi:uncharacterized protein (DUF2141 family)
MIIAAVAFSAILSCARQAAPTGGPKDITPPRIVRSIPAYGSIFFKGKKVVLTFDEFIALDKITEKLIISPPLVKKPGIIVKGKNLEIDFPEKLKDSVTYTMYFQDAVRDLNEGNPIYNFKFVFSTGSVLDSLSVTGNVFNASNLEVPENTLIMLQRNLADSAVVKIIPDYVALSDKNGGFRIDNIKPGAYNLFALQDKNNNKRYDLADEGFAFLDNVIQVTKEKNYLPVIVLKDTVRAKGVKIKAPDVKPFIGEYKLFVFTAPKKNHYLTSSERKTANQFILTLSLPPDTVKFSLNIPEAPNGSFFIEKNLTSDTIDVWITDSLLYSKRQISTIIGYPFTDSTGVTRLRSDTVPLTFTPVRTTKAMKAKEIQNKFSFKTNIPANGIRAGYPIVFISETPFRSADTMRIHLYKTDKSGKVPVPYRINKDSLTTRKYILSAKLKEGDTYLLIADSASFGNIYGALSDSTGIKFSVRTSETYSKLTLNISGVKGYILIQLLDTKEKLLYMQEITKDGKIVFPMLDVGKYRIRAIDDLNRDGKWTTGDFKFRQQPEPVTYFPGEIEIRANFDNDQDWSLKNWNQKDQKLRESKENK